MGISVKAIKGTALGISGAPFSVTSAVDYVLTNPCTSFISLDMTASGKNLILSDMAVENSLRSGQSIKIENSGYYPFTILAIDGFTVIYDSLDCLAALELFFLDDGSDNGSYIHTLSLNPERFNTVYISSPYEVQPSDLGKTFVITTGGGNLQLLTITAYPTNFFFHVFTVGGIIGNINPHSGEMINGKSVLSLNNFSAATIINVNTAGSGTYNWLLTDQVYGGFDSSGILMPAFGGTGVDNSTNTLTINANSTINQDVSTTASPTFAGLSVSVTGSDAQAFVTSHGTNHYATLTLTRSTAANAGAYVSYAEAGSEIWFSGMINGDSKFHIFYEAGTLDALNINSSGVINIPNLTASSLVTTDSSKNLVSSNSPTLSALTIANTGTNAKISISSTTTGSANEGSLFLSRGDQANGYAQTHYATTSTEVWATGLRAGDTLFHFYQTGTSDAMTLSTAGNLTIGGVLGAGIVSWSPVIGDGTNNFSTSTASGQYVKFGNMVWFTLDIIWTGKGSAVAGSNLNISLPLAISSSWHRASFTFSFVQGITWAPSTGQLAITASASNSTAQFFEIFGAGGGANQLLVSNASTTGELQLSGFYSV